MTDATRNARRPLILAGVCVLCVILAAAARWGQDLRQQRLAGLFADSVASESSINDEALDALPWFSIDGDGLYHTRRVQRIFDEGFPVAATDPLLNSPDGADIPWPPYYDAVLYAVLSPFAPDDAEERQIFLEHYCALLPFWFSLLTTVLLVGVVVGLVRNTRPSAEDSSNAPSNLAIIGAFFAGVYFAWNYGAAHYGAPGIGDHHAWVSLLTLMMWSLISFGMRGNVLDRPRAAAGYGTAAGLIAGLLLGSWVASLISILLIQIAFGILLLLQSKHPREGLAPMGFAFHIAAFLAVLSAVISSPWKEEFPWMVVNLSWFHLWHLALGAIVFIPLLRKPGGGRFHPITIPVSFLGLIAICMIGKFGPGTGILQGMAWASRADEFMSGIAESEPLWGGATEFGDSFTWLGYGWVLLPAAWLAMLSTSYKRRDYSLLIWLVAIPVLFLQAMTQRRFAEALAAPMALCLGWWLSQLLGKWSVRREWIAAAAAILLAVGLNSASTSGALKNISATPDPDPVQNAYREVLQWIGEQPKYSTTESVLAPWDQGHAIEWLTHRGSVATNFGTYVGEDSYRDPARFFLATDRQVAEQILQRRKTRYVVRPSQLPLGMDSLSKALQDDRVFVESFDNQKGKRRDRFTALWYQTMASILWTPAAVPEGQPLGVGNGDPDGPYQPLSPIQFLRFVRLSPVPDSDPRHGGLVLPAAEVWEYVAGAQLQTELNPGETLFIQAGFTLYFGEQPLLSFEYRDSTASASAGVSGSETAAKTTATLRFPYSTSDPSGNGAAQVNSAEYWIESATGEILRKGPLQVLEEDVLRGNIIELN